jgi:hypothetical protein
MDLAALLGKACSRISLLFVSMEAERPGADSGTIMILSFLSYELRQL